MRECHEPERARTRARRATALHSADPSRPRRCPRAPRRRLRAGRVARRSSRDRPSVVLRSAAPRCAPARSESERPLLGASGCGGGLRFRLGLELRGALREHVVGVEACRRRVSRPSTTTSAPSLNMSGVSRLAYIDGQRALGAAAARAARSLHREAHAASPRRRARSSRAPRSRARARPRRRRRRRLNSASVWKYAKDASLEICDAPTSRAGPR